MNIGDIFQLGVDILSSAVDAATNKMRVNTGSVKNDTEGFHEADNVEWWQHAGFASRPSKPTAGKAAAQALIIRQGSHNDIAFASQDTRSLETYGNLKEGETCVYGPGDDGNSQGRVLIKDDGSVTLYTTDNNTPTGNMVMLRISPSGGLEFTSQWGSMVFDQTGFHVKTQAGPRLDMGGIALPGVPSQVTGAFAGYAKLTAPTVALEGANTVLGMGPIFNQAVTGFSPLMIGGGPVPLSMADLLASSLFGSNTVWISM